MEGQALPYKGEIKDCKQDYGGFCVCFRDCMFAIFFQFSIYEALILCLPLVYLYHKHVMKFLSSVIFISKGLF